MSTEQLQAFETAVKTDTALQEEVSAMGSDLDPIVAVGRREGYTFSTDELATYLKSYQGQGGRELSDEELESIAGAGWTGGTDGCTDEPGCSFKC